MTDVRNGSSPYVSCPRPHRGSRNMFTFGVHTDRQWNRVGSMPSSCCMFHFARVSSLVAVKTLSTNGTLNDAAIPIGSGNTVTFVWLARPWSASLHQLNLFIPRRGMAGDSSHMSDAFSSIVRR